jgi:formamidase
VASCSTPTAPDSAVPANRAGREGLRTGPPRENGGNLDIRPLFIGARIQRPVLVEEALFSVGDWHFAQGDGEVWPCDRDQGDCAVARRTRPWGRASRQGDPDAVYLRDRTAANDWLYFVTTDLSIADGAVSMTENTAVAARNALLDLIDYLIGRGFTGEQAYVLRSVAVDLRISQIVDVPHATGSATLP